MTQTIIRKAHYSDLEILLQFEQGLIDAERPFDPSLKPGPIHYYDLKSMLIDPKVHVVVAEDEGQVIACGYACIESAKPFFKNEMYAYLGFMYVHPAHRRKGLNRKIMEALKKWASLQGLQEMRLQVYVENEPAIRAYEKTGFIKQMIEMRMELH